MKKLAVIAVIAVCLLARQAWADSVSVDTGVGNLTDQNGNLLGDDAIGIFVVDTGTNGLAGLTNLSPTSSLAAGSFLTAQGGATGEYLVLDNRNIESTSGMPGYYGTAIYHYVYPSDPIVMTGQKLFCLWFPSLTTSSTEVGAGTWYGAYRDPATTQSGLLDYSYIPDQDLWVIPPGGYSVMIGANTPNEGGGTPASDLRASLPEHSLPGDANLDGQVDVNDLTIVLAHYGQTGMAWTQGEFTGDGTVDVNDLTIVLAHYGQSVGASAGSLAAVPEPGSAAPLAGIGLAMLFGWRRSRGRRLSNQCRGLTAPVLCAGCHAPPTRRTFGAMPFV